MASPTPGTRSAVPRIGSDKEAVRAEVRVARAARSAEDRAVADAARTARLLAHLGRWRPSVVAAYASAGDEPGTAALLDELATWAMVLLPVLSARPDGSRRGPDWAVYDGGERLRSGPRGIPEPSGGTLGPEAVQRADLVVMPGLAGTPGGDRVGTGGGWYDRALAGAAAPRWLLLYEDEVYESLPSDPWDLPVSALVTPSRVIDCG